MITAREATAVEYEEPYESRIPTTISKSPSKPRLREEYEGSSTPATRKVRM
jgi:hypothetical protein